MKQFFTLSFLFLVLLGGCVRGSAPLPTATIRPTDVSLPKPTPSSVVDSPTPKIITGENVYQIQEYFQLGLGSVYDAQLSPDETTIAVSTSTGVYLYDFVSLENYAYIERIAYAIAFSPDGKYLALGGDEIQIWDLSGSKVEQIVENQVEDSTIIRIEFSPDGNTLIATTRKSHAPCDATGFAYSLYALNSGEMIFNRVICPDDTEEYSYFKIVNERTMYLVGRIIEEGAWLHEVTPIDLSTGNIISASIFTTDVFIGDITLDGKTFAHLQLREPTTTTLTNENDGSISASFAGDVVFTKNPNIWLLHEDETWESVTPERETICEFPAPFRIGYSYREGGHVMRLRGTSDFIIQPDTWHQFVNVWGLQTCELKKQLYFPEVDSNLSFSPDSRIIAAGSSYHIHLWNTQNGQYINSLAGDDGRGGNGTFSFNSNSDLIVQGLVGYQESFISIYGANTGKRVYNFKLADMSLGSITDNSNVSRVSINPSGTRILYSDSTGVHILDTELSEINTLDEKRDTTGWFNPNGSMFIVVNDYSLAFYDASSGEALVSISKPKYSTYALDENWEFVAIYSKDASEISVTNLMTGQVISNLNNEGNSTSLEFISFLENGDRLVGSNNEIARIWDLETGKIIQEITFPNEISEIAIHSDENILVTYDEVLSFWDLGTGEIFHQLEVDFNIRYLMFSPDGTMLALMGDGLIEVWGIP